MQASAAIPVNVLTGFLGSGKTSLLNRLLRAPAFANCAVLINEFGEVGIDHHLIDRVQGDVVLLRSGCICCTIRGDLAKAMRDLHSRRERGEVPAYTRLVIETTGLADPTPVLATVMHDSVLQHHYRPGNVLTTVDVLHGAGQLADHPECRKQAALADRLVLTKCDLAAPAQAEALRAQLAAINPGAEIVEAGAPDSVPDADLLLGQDVFDIDSKSAEVARWLRAAGRRQYFPVHGGDVNVHRDIHAFGLELAGDLDWTAFSIWLSLLLHRHGDKVLRLKGLLNVSGVAEPVVLHGVQQLIHPPSHLAAWPDEVRSSRLVFIVRGLEREAVERSLADFQSLLASPAQRPVARPAGQD
jgi:G3E family GTPase